MAGGNASSAAAISHQQRHSIQLPVQYAQGNYAANFGLYNFNSQSVRKPFVKLYSNRTKSLFRRQGSPSSYSQGSPGYQPESPHSGPNSPSAVGNPESPSPAGSQQNQGSPGSPYYSLPAQLQNINIVRFFCQDLNFDTKKFFERFLGFVRYDVESVLLQSNSVQSSFCYVDKSLRYTSTATATTAVRHITARNDVGSFRLLRMI